jgi:hypothetical protein
MMISIINLTSGQIRGAELQTVIHVINAQVTEDSSSPEFAYTQIGMSRLIGQQANAGS